MMEFNNNPDWLTAEHSTGVSIFVRVNMELDFEKSKRMLNVDLL